MTPYKPLVISEIREEIKDFKTFVFAGRPPFDYQAGQFITLIDQSRSAEIRRSYSITSSPVLQEPLSIAVKRIDNGIFSRKLVDYAQVGDTLLTTGPAGFFRLPDNIKNFTSIFFFAAGSGIAPIFSLIKTILHLYPGIQVSLIYSNPSLKSTAFYRELKDWEKKFTNQLKIDFIFSSVADLRKARLNRELLLEFLTIRQYDREETLFYICGPESYMRMIIFLLVEEGFNKNHIKKEDFNPGNKKTISRLPPDKNSYTVQIEMNGVNYNFPVPYPDSILQSARKVKLDLPYSCETGKCGSCAALCLSGNVWISNNEVLTDEDLARGLILTCTGHPQSSDVILKME